MNFLPKILPLLCFLSLPFFSLASTEESDSTCTATQLSPVLPVDIRSQSTCNDPNDYTSLACGSTASLKGNDHLFRITPLVTQQVDLFLINLKDVYTNSFPEESLSLFVLDNCPNNNAQCIDHVEGDHSVRLTGIVLKAATTYYILVSSEEKCVDYSLLIKPTAQYALDNLVIDSGFDHIVEDQCGYQQIGANLSVYSPTWSTPNHASTDLWSLLTGAPVCLTNPRSTHPLRLGNQEPRSGHAYAGMMISPGPNNLYREYIQTKLSQPLLRGQMYEVSWYVSLGESSSLTAKGWGACFSETKIDTLGFSLVGMRPQVRVQTLVRDTNNWVRISGTFTATASYEYLTIGFFASPSTTSWYLTGHGNNAAAYYFVDDVELKPIFPVFLPVTQVNLSAYTLPSAHIQLDWASWDEQLLSHYEIERAGPDGQFMTLDQSIKAIGAPQEMADYSYEDRSTFGMRELHYRLRMVDQDGSFAYSDVVSIFPPQHEQLGQLSPNPFRNEMAIAWQHQQAGSIEVQILDVSGKSVKQTFFHRDAGVQKLLIQDLQGLPSGVYFVRIQDEDYSETHRLLKR